MDSEETLNKGVSHIPGRTSRTAGDFATLLRTEWHGILNSRIVCFWNFPCRIFGPRLTVDNWDRLEEGDPWMHFRDCKKRALRKGKRYM